jgi:beta-galactosidase
MSSSGPRTSIELRLGFRFRLGEAPPASEELVYDDSDWELVELPHTWNALDATARDMHRGIGHYRLRFSGPPLEATKRAYLMFDGVGTVSSVWLNGHALGDWFSGTAAACYDVSAALRAGAENLLLVRADNRANDDVPPQGGDFSMCGGIYRGARLVLTSGLAIDLLDHASPGVFITTPEVSQAFGRVRCRVRLRNAEAAARSVLVVLVIQDDRGQAVERTRSHHLATPGVSEVVLEVVVEQPRLWRGRVAPCLYVASVEVYDAGDDRLLDASSQTFGFRVFAVSAERGFLLNGEPYELRGVNLHQDGPRAAWAMSEAERERDFELVRELGATFVRLVHYQHDQHAYALADRLGLVVWAEHALVNTVGESPLFAERAALQLTALIRQSFNHPSIAVWGIGNEVQTHAPPQAKRLLTELAALVKSEDPSRPSAISTCYDEPAGTYGVDLIAHNKYFGWYTGVFADLTSWLDAQHARPPGGSFGMSEYGAGAGMTLHASEPKALDHSEEYQCLFHEQYWHALSQRSWLWCKAVWQMFDAASAGRDEGDTPGINDKGLVTRDRLTKKDAFFWYRACWSDEAIVHVTGRRARERERRTDVKVYSSCDEVELRVNGSSRGVVRVVAHIALFRDVALDSGENTIEAEGRRPGATVRDECSWAVL